MECLCFSVGSLCISKFESYPALSTGLIFRPFSGVTLNGMDIAELKYDGFREDLRGRSLV